MTKPKTSLLLTVATRAICAALVVAVAGCSKTDITKPKRSAVEQLLISRAADNALGEMDLSSLNGKKVFFEEKYFATDSEKSYVLGSIRNLISASGGLLVDAAADAEIIVEARAGALSIDNGDSLVGLPEMPVPIPLAGQFVTPEVALFKAEKQFSVAKIALFAYDAKTRLHFLTTGNVAGHSHHHYYRILGMVNWVRSDLPEKRTKFTGD